MIEGDETQGMSGRELLIEVRSDVKEIVGVLSGKVGRVEMYSALGLVVTMVVAVVFAVA